MIILKPFAAYPDPDNPYTTNLYFEGGAIKRFYMRGSVAWPEGKKEGFAILAGLDLDSKKVIIFEEWPFWTVSHWLNDDGTIRERKAGGFHLGLIQFLQDNASKYKCNSYFWGGQHIDIWTRFATETYKHPMSSRRLELIEVPYVKENGDDILNEKLATRTFKGQAGSMLSESVSKWEGMQAVKGESGDNAVLALKTLLAGFDYLPWVEVKDYEK